ncbi:von Willebrand factor A domain-containing protein 5A [Fasciola gigantica]|uniref:von Willebrand factor A domain-containing protein 5A n=1 Tax=Fasciola gigantica TaxID=46835 RepID=A0A504Y560_FASGI|nr:von Willebrand factor A domain-containing protein 5A [Fasciola gigantica]
MSSSECGVICLAGYSSEPWVALEKVEIHCSVTDLTAYVQTTCIYESNIDEPMEAAYVFPLNDVALFNFEARIEDRIIVAECRPRTEAKTTYDDAVASGHMAYIAEQDEGCEDVFRMRLGNIPGRSAVTIMLKYVNQLDAESLVDDKIHTRATFTLPGFLNPRYTPKESRIDKEFDIIDRSETLKPYSMNFTGDLAMPFRMIAVSSPRDKFEVEWRSTDQTSATVKLSAFHPDHDLQMVIDFEQKLDSFAVCEWGDRQANNILSKDCIMAQFIPDFTEFANEIETRTEVYFIIDRSGSMSGSNIECAAESLLLFLKSLPSGCRFQIIGFGSTYETLFPEPVEYNEQSLARAIECQRKLEADLGGTEVYPALEEALKAPLTGAGWYKQIIFFTDGDVSNADEHYSLGHSVTGSTGAREQREDEGERTNQMRATDKRTDGEYVGGFPKQTKMAYRLAEGKQRDPTTSKIA